MAWLDKIVRGKTPMPPRILLYGVEGIGKSTFASNAPRPIFIPTEDGLNEIDCHRFPLAAGFNDVLGCLHELHQREHAYETIAIDTLDGIERMISDMICRQHGVQTIEQVGGGFGRGYMMAICYWREFLEAIEHLRIERGMTAILVAHSKVERFEDPESTAYDRYSPRLNKHACALITEWADAVLFAHWHYCTDQEDAGFGRTRTFARQLGTNRLLRCSGGPACLAKNRYGIVGSIPFDWNHLYSQIAAFHSASSDLPMTKEN